MRRERGGEELHDGAGRVDFDNMDTAKLEAFISEKMSATRLPGLSIALVKGEEVVYSRGFGLADVERTRAATPQTLYGAASITKSFTAISILQLAEKGLESWRKRAWVDVPEL